MARGGRGERRDAQYPSRKPALTAGDVLAFLGKSGPLWRAAKVVPRMEVRPLMGRTQTTDKPLRLCVNAGVRYIRAWSKEATSLLMFCTAAVRKHCSRMFRIPSMRA